MNTLRVATYNIHKGVQGVGPRRRLEIHNLGLAIGQFDADVICLQEVRKLHRGEARYFTHWPELPQADFLAPDGYQAVYRTNAYTRHGEHGNALLSRWPVLDHQHEDMSDHRFEQRGLLHSELLVRDCLVHVVVVHLGLIRPSRPSCGVTSRAKFPPTCPCSWLAISTMGVRSQGANWRKSGCMPSKVNARRPSPPAFPWYNSTMCLRGACARWVFRCCVAVSGGACQTTFP